MLFLQSLDLVAVSSLDRDRADATTYRDAPLFGLLAWRLDVHGTMTCLQPGQDDRTFAIIGAAREVHRVMRRGFLEAIYYEALALEFKLREIPFVSQVSLEYRRFALSEQ